MMRKFVSTAVSVLHPSRSLLAGFLLLFVSAGLFSRRIPADGRGIQPIQFNHAKHLASGMNCTDCHTGAQTGEKATLPAATACMACHESGLTNSPEEAKLRAAAAAGEIAWKPVTRVASHVFFSHRRHAGLAAIACATCHGAMDKATRPPANPLAPIGMDACIACHRKSKASTDCNDCHR